MRIYENVPQSTADTLWFKNESLKLLGQQLMQRAYPGYPEHEQRLFCPDLVADPREAITEAGSWWTEDPRGIMLPEMPEDNADRNGFELHPWFEEMVRHRSIGVLAGRGAYRYRGKNHTADPIITRHDLGEPHVLLITRTDTGASALPGGFIGRRETPLQAAMREPYEEAHFQLEHYPFVVRKVYEGPLADLRVTAHAWPYTHAYHFALDPRYTHNLPIGFYKGGDDAETAGWVPRSQALGNLFGSHQLLGSLAFRE